MVDRWQITAVGKLRGFDSSLIASRFLGREILVIGLFGPWPFRRADPSVTSIYPTPCSGQVVDSEDRAFDAIVRWTVARDLCPVVAFFGAVFWLHKNSGRGTTGFAARTK